MPLSKWVAYIGDAGLFIILTVRAFADYLMHTETLGAIGGQVQRVFLAVMSAMGDHRMLFQSIIIAVLIAMSLGGHFALERDSSRRR
jgi:hypothetical protein